MTNRYTSFEATAALYTDDTHTFGADRHDIDVVTEELSPERNNVYAVTSKGRTPRTKLNGPLGWSGNIECLLYPIEAPTLIYYAMGAISSTPDMPVTGVDTHLITPAAVIPHFILEVGRDVVAHKYTGVVATGYTLEYAPDAAVTVNVDVNARKEQANAALGSVTFADFNIAERAYGGVEVDTLIGAAESGSPTSFGTVESFSFTYDNNFEDGAYVLGDRHLSGNFVNQINATGNFDLSFLAIADYDDVVGDVEKELELAMTQGTGAAERSVKFTFPRISYDTTSLPTNNAERFVQGLEFTANDNAAGDAVIMEVINAQDEAQFTA